MIGHWTRNGSRIRRFLTGYSQYSTAHQKWDLQTAICLERKPIIAPTLTALEAAFHQVLSEVEVENSYKSDFEIRHEEDLKQLEILKKGGGLDENELNVKQTAQDLLDMWTNELSKFQPAPKSTEGCKNSESYALMKKIDKHLVMIVSETGESKKHQTLPLDFRQEGETLRQSAERVLKKYCGDSVVAQIYGNAPCGFYKYKYPLEIRNKTGVQGAKVFIYFARYLRGNGGESNEYKWLDRTELGSILHPECYKAVAQFLIDE